MCCCGVWSSLDALLRWLCCNPRRATDDAASLLSSDQPRSTAPPGFSHESEGDEGVGLLSDGDELLGGTVVVMRHGHRQDEQDPVWHRTAKRPWDPPLSTKGRVQAREAAAAMRALGVEVVVTSPFRRCLQTSAEIVAEMALPQGAWLVDWGLSEVCDPRVLFSGRPDVTGWIGRKDIVRWMWDGLSIEAALDAFIQHDGSYSGVAIRPELLAGTTPPSFPETLDQGLQRYTRRIQAVMRAHAGKRVLVVTHGEAVRQAVVMYDAQAEVYEVKHTGYVYMQRLPAEDGHWRLCSLPGESGVMWIE